MSLIKDFIPNMIADQPKSSPNELTCLSAAVFVTNIKKSERYLQ